MSSKPDTLEELCHSDSLTTSFLDGQLWPTTKKEWEMSRTTTAEQLRQINALRKARGKGLLPSTARASTDGDLAASYLCWLKEREAPKTTTADQLCRINALRKAQGLGRLPSKSMAFTRSDAAARYLQQLEAKLNEKECIAMTTKKCNARAEKECIAMTAKEHNAEAKRLRKQEKKAAERIAAVKAAERERQRLRRVAFATLETAAANGSVQAACELLNRTGPLRSS